MAHGEQVFDLGQQIMREALRVGEFQVDQIIHRCGVGVGDGGVVQECLGLVPRRAADHMREGQHVNLAAFSLGLRLQGGDFGDGA